MSESAAAGLFRDDVYRAVVEQIVAGRLLPGMRLSERTLAAEFGVSRMPVKEAVRRLESEGFVRALPRHGIVVATSAQDSVLDAVRVRAVLEGLAAGLLASDIAHRSDRGIDSARELRAVMTQMRAASRRREVDTLRAVNARFHEVIRVDCGNRYVAHLSSAVLAVDAAVRRRALADLAEMRRGVREHASISRSILAGDAVTAETQMRAHILRTGAFVLTHLNAAEGQGQPR